MQIIADLQLHSKYSRAVSGQMTIPFIGEWAAKKGIGLVATGDWTHPLWIREIEANLEEDGNGLLRLKSQIPNSKFQTNSKFKIQNSKLDSPLFLLATEVSSIYSQGGKGRRVHTLIWVPTLAAAEKINEALRRRGCNLMSDGRPIIGLSCIEAADLVLNIEPKALIIAAHAWTPWYSVFGGMSGFDSLDEAFGKFAKNVYAVETGLSCYDKKTEVLTDDGWKKISEVLYSDKVCTLNLKTDGIEFQNPIRLFKYQYEGKMYRLRTRRVDLLVTPNHRVLVRSCDFRNQTPFFLKEAELLFNKSKIFKKDGIWTGKEKKYFTLPAVKVKHGNRYHSGFRKAAEKKFPIKPWLKFFGFWIAEGWTTVDKKGQYNVCLANQNKVLLFEMKELWRSFGYNVYHGDNVLRVRNYQLFQYLKQFGKSPDKFIPSDIKSLSKELLAILLEYYLRGDGHVYGRNKKGLSATTSSIHLRDDLQEIALKIGISAYFKRGGKKDAVITSLPYKNKFYKNKQDIWRIYFIRQNRPVVIPSMIKRYNYTESWIDFNGQVFCLAVPNQVIYIRRNGIPLWCGNSNPSMNWRIKELDNRAILSFSDAHSGPKLGREATIFKSKIKNQKSKIQIKNQIFSYDDIYGAIAEASLGKNDGKLEIGYTVEFYPEEGKYHYSGHRNCGVSFGPEETVKNKGICPVCGRSLTQGVMQRVEELAGRTESDLQLSVFGSLPAAATPQALQAGRLSVTGQPVVSLPVGTHKPINRLTDKQEAENRKLKTDNRVQAQMIGSEIFPKRPPFAMLVPLLEIIAEAIGSPVSSPKTLLVYENLVKTFGGEFAVLLTTSIDEIGKIGGERVAEGIEKVRKGNIEINPGYDGVFGKVKIWGNEEQELTEKKEQLSLF